MTTRDGEGPSLDGMAIEDAVEAVLASNEETTDREDVRATLEQVSEGGVVSRDAVDAALGHVAKVVSTPETRLELAQESLANARATVEPVADLDAVAYRLADYEERLASIEAGVDELAEDLQSLTEREDVYAVAAGLEERRTDADDLQRRADVLLEDLETFDAWATDPDVRFDELAADVDVLDDAMIDLERTADAIAEAAETGERIGTQAGAVDPAVAWVDSALRQRVLALFVTDVRAELDDLRTWGERLDLTADDDQFDSRADDLGEWIDTVEERCDHLDSRLATIVDPDWERQFGGDVQAFETALEPFEPPVQWGAVEDVLAEYRVDVVE